MLDDIKIDMVSIGDKILLWFVVYTYNRKKC